MQNGGGEVSLSFTMSGASGSETEEAEEAGTGANPNLTRLPLPAPGRLGELGLSKDEVQRLHAEWMKGALTYQQMTQEHGREAADLLKQAWEYIEDQQNRGEGAERQGRGHG